MAAKELGFQIHRRSDAAVEPNIVTINVGGQIFQTTKQTLAAAGPSSLIARVSESPSPFVDRDPELFSILLSLLRTGNLPSKARDFDFQDLIFESRFYGIESLLIDAVSSRAQFDSFSLERSSLLVMNGRDSPSAISATEIGSIIVAHGSKITSFDWSLKRKNTILTRFSAVDSILAISPAIAAAGATDFSGLQAIELETGVVRSSLSWENSTRSDSTVQAIGSSRELLFVSFESGRRNSNTIMAYDLDTLSFVAEIGRNEIYGSEFGSAIPATKLIWVQSHGLLMASGSHGGPSGVNGNVRFWDVRSGNKVFEVQETIDCFSDVTVSEASQPLVFKVGVNSGEAYFGDIRNLGQSQNPWWVCLGDERKGLGGKKEGLGCKIESHGRQVFCTKGGDIELWSEVSMGRVGGGDDNGDGSKERVFRNNLMGKAREIGGGDKITNLGFGGNKMFVTRKDQQCVEVWQSSPRPF